MQAVNVIAGIAFDPEIRGVLVVITGVIVLMGSVWLLLVTNTGVRLGTALALAAFFGWMTILSTIWWIYGIGWVGDSPSWKLQEINVSDLDAAALDEATRLPDLEELPTAFGLVSESDDPVARAEFGPVSADTLTPDQTAGLSAAEIADLAAFEEARNEATTLSELAAVAPGVIDEAIGRGELDLGGWKLLSTAESGEAQASATAFLVESPDFDFATTAEFKVLDAYTIGGKPERSGDGVLDRVTHRITSTLRVTHPTHYGIVQVQAVTAESLRTTPGQAPPLPEVDPSRPVISIIMIRDLGNLRLKPALAALGSFAVFAALSLFLHERDKEVMARQAVFEAGS